MNGECIVAKVAVDRNIAFRFLCNVLPRYASGGKIVGRQSCENFKFGTNRAAAEARCKESAGNDTFLCGQGAVVFEGIVGKGGARKQSRIPKAFGQNQNDVGIGEVICLPGGNMIFKQCGNRILGISFGTLDVGGENIDGEGTDKTVLGKVDSVYSVDSMDGVGNMLFIHDSLESGKAYFVKTDGSGSLTVAVKTIEEEK